MLSFLCRATKRGFQICLQKASGYKIGILPVKNPIELKYKGREDACCGEKGSDELEPQGGQWISCSEF